VRAPSSTRTRQQYSGSRSRSLNRDDDRERTDGPAHTDDVRAREQILTLPLGANLRVIMHVIMEEWRRMVVWRDVCRWRAASRLVSPNDLRRTAPKVTGSDNKTPGPVRCLQY
jgi:hypothetical protein